MFLSCLLECFSEHLDPVNVKIAELREALESVVSEQKYLKARDTRHRHSESFSIHLLHFYKKKSTLFPRYEERFQMQNNFRAYV